MHAITIGKRAAAALALVMTSALFAACGSTSTSTTTRASAGAFASAGAGAPAHRAAFRQCLRRHGITLPARPRHGTPRPFRGRGELRANPRLRAAILACAGRNFHPGRRLQILAAGIKRFVACVRGHGYNLPTPNFSRPGRVFPRGIRTDPKFRAASRACRGLLFPPRSARTSSARA